MEKEDKLAELEALLQVKFNDRSLLKRAITHHSCCRETAIRDSYDTLEFLGDAILGAHVVEYIYRNFPDASEGGMTALKSEVVSRRILSKIGQEIGLFSYIRVDLANMRTFNDRSRDSLCTDVLEAIIGAIHIDQGPEAARDFVARTILAIVPYLSKQTLNTNPKRRLQKIVLPRSNSLPPYRVLEQSERNTNRVFTVVIFDNEFLLVLEASSTINDPATLLDIHP